MTRKARALVITVALLVAAAALSGGCGKESRDPGETLAAGVQAARDAGSTHAQINVSLSPLEGEKGMGLNVQGDAWLDMQASALEARFTVMGMELSLRFVEGTAYLQFGGRWYVLTPGILEGMGEDTITAALDVLAIIPDILSSNAEVEELGDEEVAGYRCTRLKVVPDFQAIVTLQPVQRLAGELGMDPEELAAYLEDARVVMEVCVQRDEPVIRQAYLAADVELSGIADLVGMAMLPELARMEMTVNFPEYGVKVEVQAPAEAAPFTGL